MKQKKEKEKEENLIIEVNNNKNDNYDNNINNQFEKKKCICCRHCLNTCCDFLSDCCCGCLDECFEKCDTEAYEDFNLQISFLIYFVQYLTYLIILLTVKINDKTEQYIPVMVIITLYSTYIFFKLEYKKNIEKLLNNGLSIFFYFLIISTFKGIIYFLIYLLIKEGFKNENACDIFIGCFSFKMGFLLFCSFYFMIREGCVNYIYIFLIGIFLALIVSLIIFFCFSLLEFEIELIICCVQIILFNIGITVSSAKNSLLDNILWNTLNVEIYKLCIILYPIFGICEFCLIFWTCGTIKNCCNT